MNILHINVNNKVATYLKRDGDIVCGNSDYQIQFTFDSAWDAVTEKTARFVWNGKFYDVPFSGTLCDVPIITDTPSVAVGVYAGELRTTTPAQINCQKSILCVKYTDTHDADLIKTYRDAALDAAEKAEASATSATLSSSHAQQAASSADDYATEAQASAEAAKSSASFADDRATDAQEAAADAKETVDSMIETSKNLYNIKAITVGASLRGNSEYGGLTGTPSRVFSYENGAVSDFIRVEAGETYVFSYVVPPEDPGAFALRVHFCDNDEILVADANAIHRNIAFVIPEGATQLRFSLTKSAMQSGTLQLEKGSVATEYEPYYIRIKKEFVGDIEEALDAIHEIQDDLIDGYNGDDYYAHWNYRVQQLTADLPTIPADEMDYPMARRGIAMLDINGYSDATLHAKVVIMHPKSSGEFSLEYGDTPKHILVAMGVTNIIGFVDLQSVLDLTLFTGNMPFPTLRETSDGLHVLVQKGRKAELEKMTNWSVCFIEEVETW